MRRVDLKEIIWHRYLKNKHTYYPDDNRISMGYAAYSRNFSDERQAYFASTRQSRVASVEILNHCKENGLSFPLHTSHRLQPLDWNVFGLLKWYSAYAGLWFKLHPRIPKTIYDISTVLKEALLKFFKIMNFYHRKLLTCWEHWNVSSVDPPPENQRIEETSALLF